jgi:ABC-2 type transport system permease protein
MTATTTEHGGVRRSTKAPTWPLIGVLNARSARSMRRIPAALIPTIVMPVFFTVAFTGTFRGLTLLPGYPTDNIWNWMVPYACVQTASFAAMGAAFGLGRDLETGFYDRLLVAPVRSWAVPASGVLWSVVRTAIPVTICLVLGVIGGLTFPSGALAVLWMTIAAAGVATMAALWGQGVMYRTKKQSAGGMVQIGLFIVMFLSVGMVPLDLQEGWLPKVAKYNPLTPILTLARAGFVYGGDWADVWPGLLSILVCTLLLLWWALRGMRSLVP